MSLSYAWCKKYFFHDFRILWACMRSLVKTHNIEFQINSDVLWHFLKISTSVQGPNTNAGQNIQHLTFQTRVAWNPGLEKLPHMKNTFARTTCSQYIRLFMRENPEILNELYGESFWRNISPFLTSSLSVVNLSFCPQISTDQYNNTFLMLKYTKIWMHLYLSGQNEMGTNKAKQINSKRHDYKKGCAFESCSSERWWNGFWRW